MVRVPIAMDDFALHTGAIEYSAWEDQVMETARNRPFTAIGLHDCYSDHWIEGYPSLLERLGSVARLRRIGDVTDDLFLGAGI